MGNEPDASRSRSLSRMGSSTRNARSVTSASASADAAARSLRGNGHPARWRPRHTTNLGSRRREPPSPAAAVVASASASASRTARCTRAYFAIATFASRHRPSPRAHAPSACRAHSRPSSCALGNIMRGASASEYRASSDALTRANGRSGSATGRASVTTTSSAASAASARPIELSPD